MKGTMVSFALFFSLFLLSTSQQIGVQKKEEHLVMNIEECKGKEDCTKENAFVVLDSNWRWLHIVGDFVNCYTGNEWDPEYCPDAATCTENCALDGVDKVDWEGTYGVTSDKTGITLKFVTKGPYSTNIGSRMYLLDSSEEKYKMFYLKNREFTFDVDVSQLPCGLNGALYFVEMAEDGGLSIDTNDCGAAYGTGYCDAQCPHDMKWIEGEANCEDWNPSDNDANSGAGHYGACCVEMDIWESNSVATSYTPHTCSTVGPVRCEGTDCGDNASDERYDGMCDKDGCDFNPWRMGDKTFFGPGSDFTVDTTKPMTVVTQFLTSDGTDSGDLVEIRRLFVQDGKVIPHAHSNMEGMDVFDSITQEFCDQAKAATGDIDDYGEHGGMKGMGESLDRGMVLVMSMWDDHDANMLWLDSNYPLDKDPSEPGISRGPCPEDSGKPEDMEANYPDATVKYFNVRYGEIGSTYPDGENPTQPPHTTHGPHTTEGPICPGGSLANCVAMCPDNPVDVHEGCVQECQKDCPE